MTKIKAEKDAKVKAKEEVISKKDAYAKAEEVKAKKDVKVKAKEEVISKKDTYVKAEKEIKAKKDVKVKAKEEDREEVKVKEKTKDILEVSIEEKLLALNNLQTVDSKIDRIKTLRGELPLEVQDLEDEIAGLETRINKFEEESKTFEKAISTKKTEIKQADILIKKYTEQQNNVRNNREYDSLTKEIEFQQLEIQLCEKRIKEYTIQMNEKKDEISKARVGFDERKKDLVLKVNELKGITEETQKEEDELLKKSVQLEKVIDPRLLSAYKRIRINARNGLAVVGVERNACGGCFNKVPPQRQLEIKTRKKIIVCEYCGRIIIDPEIVK